MKTTVVMCKDGKPVKVLPWWKNTKSQYMIGSWPDEGTAYGVRGVLRAMGLPDHVEVIRRESSYIYSGASKGTEYAPDWKALATALKTTHKSFLKMTEETGDLLPIEIAELPGTVYAEHHVRDGGDALALFSRKKEEAAPINDSDGHFHHAKPLSVRAIIRGVSENKDGTITPCVYVLYEGNREKISEALEAMSNIAEMVSNTLDSNKYTLRIVQE